MDGSLTYSITLTDKAEVKPCLFTNFFLEDKKPKHLKPFYKKLLKILRENDFELPELNIMKWPGWPSKSPKKVEKNRMKNVFPKYETGPLRLAIFTGLSC